MQQTNRSRHRHITSFQVISLGFLSVILLGSLLLMLPIATKSGQSTSFLDALFTATSAVCVTGLVIKDTATYWSLLSEVGQMLIIMLMLIGGSPGSTAGGMKTTTLAVLVSSALSVFRKKEHTHFFGRQIPDGTIRNAATIFLMYIVLFLVGGMVISSTEDIPLMAALFETASAIGTVGLSLGITPDLGLFSHIILICLMFFGRVGGLTLIFATISEKRPIPSNKAKRHYSRLYRHCGTSHQHD